MQREPFFLFNFFLGLWRLATGRFEPPKVVISDVSQYRTELRLGSDRLVVDTRSRLITKNGSQFLRFDAIESIDVIHHKQDEDHPDRWEVKLRTSTFWSKTLLTTTDDADASIVAAKVSTATGKRVRA